MAVEKPPRFYPGVEFYRKDGGVVGVETREDGSQGSYTGVSREEAGAWVGRWFDGESFQRGVDYGSSKKPSSRPIALSHEQLGALLMDVFEVVRDGDSFEGSVEYLMPGPGGRDEWLSEQEWSVLPDRFRDNYEATDESTLMYAPKPVTFMVMASYRVGNSMGQGGVVMVNREALVSMGAGASDGQT